jgi:hypothetical protein
MTIPPPPPSGHEPDAALARAVAALRHLPDVPPGAVDRAVAAAVARNGIPGRRSVAAAWLARAAGLLLAAGLGAAGATWGLGRGHLVGDVPVAKIAQNSPPPAAGGLGRYVAEAAVAAEERPIETPFVLARQAAKRVAVVGDFNGWNPNANAMTADARGVWTTTVPLPPGRHAYAFVVDGTVWVTDPRAPVVRDPDYGRDQSVVLVGHP